MLPIRICIIFDKPTQEYFAGEVLSGNVVATLKKAISISEVSLKVKGIGEVKFTTTENGGIAQKTVRYYNKEVYINEKVSIFQSSDEKTFKIGQNRFPFSTQLPTTLPETCCIEHGEVRYKCKAIVKCGEKVNILSSICKESTPFTVHAVVPLPIHLHEMQTTRETLNLAFCCISCCCFSTGKVTGTLTIDKGGYIAGEAISFNAQISNKTTSNLECIKLKLTQNVQYKYSDSDVKYKTRAINKIKCTDSIRAGEEFTWPVSLTLPNPLPPTDLGTCQIITISYMLKVMVGEGNGCCAPSVDFCIPFVVCTAARSMITPSETSNTMDPAQMQKPSAYTGCPPTQPNVNELDPSPQANHQQNETTPSEVSKAIATQ